MGMNPSIGLAVRPPSRQELGRLLASPVGGQTVDDQDAHEYVRQRPNGIEEHPPNGTDRQHSSGKDSDPTAELGSRYYPKCAEDKDNGDDQVDPAVGLEAVPEECILEVLWKRPVITECPDGVEDSHDSSDPEHDPCEQEPAVTLLFHGPTSFL